MRRDPERMRLQNLNAQKRYREKRWQRIVDLENLVASIGHVSLGASASAHNNGGTEAGSMTLVSSGRMSALPETNGEMAQSEHQSSYPAASDNDDLLAVYIDTDHPFPAADTSGENASTFLWEPHGWPWGNINLAGSALPGTPRRAKLVDCGCQVLHIQVQVPSHIERSNTDLVSAFVGVPDPYMNTLRVERLCTLQALERNCMMIGITREMCCLADSISPFFRHVSPDIASNNIIVRSVQRIFHTVKPDLRPCSVQITENHHPYIDVLPFPTVRANLIRSMGSIDEDEFFIDSLSGLVCWGGTGVSRRDSAGAGTGTPWDTRSWEAKEWFVQKWWFVVGGEEGELVQQSKWWRALRGESDEVAV
ncbi:hypothetical protein F5Y08DRAFT_324211 [Xylaria arbuscula]|nr:hypothetical protein F5Y08DRAFT_324211 [Xylaria arbuscula]